MDVVTLQLAKKYTAETMAGAGAIKGDKGDPGPAGPAGATGPQGEQGPAGPQGEQGPKGDTGERGPQGDTGPVGPAGADGQPGAKGDPGEKGADGAPGPKGDPGDTPYIGSNGNWWIGDTDTGVSASGGGGGGSGTQGPKGDPGTTFTPAVSEAGELSWTNDGGLPNPSPVNIKGPQGEKGDAGGQGPQGAQGIQGIPGEQGPKGEQGESGPAGATGPAGKDATINGVNALEIVAGENVSIEQNGGTMTISASGVTGNGGSGLSGNPIGTIISYMGLTAPKDYLICDGAEYNISEYADLAKHFAAQFGSTNYFGGDGTTTFAVPDMRNLFLRGYHGESAEQLSGDIGKKQEATQSAYIVPPRVNAVSIQLGRFGSINIDHIKETMDTITYGVGDDYTFLQSGSSPSFPAYYTSRPVNMSVLYCIKARPSVPAENVYSTDETRIGTWIDGRPIYRTVINLTLTTSSASGTLNIAELPYSAINDLINIYGSVFVDDGGKVVINSHWFTISLISGVGWSFDQAISSSPHTYIIKAAIEYTKTADPMLTTLLTSDPPLTVPLSSVVTAASSSASTTAFTLRGDIV